MKHVGKMKNNGAKVIIAYRTLPGDPYSALVVGTGNLGDTYHDAIMSLLQDDSTQQANELADALAVRRFPDGSNMLEWLHTRGHLKKVPTDGVIVTPTPQSSVPLNELNNLIAEQKGVALEDLAVNDGSGKPAKKVAKKDSAVDESTEVQGTEDLTPAQLRSKADALFKQAQQLRKQADELDPPKSKKKATVEAE
jgi:hypothetical protein